MQKHFGDKPQNLAVVLSECLKEEKKVLATASQKQVKYDTSHCERFVSVWFMCRRDDIPGTQYLCFSGLRWSSCEPELDSYRQQSRWPEKTDDGKLTWTVSVVHNICPGKNIFLCTPIQEVRKEMKSLEVLNENLDYLQKNWLIKGTL